LSAILAFAQVLIGCVGTRPGRGVVTLHGIASTRAEAPWRLDIQNGQGRIDVEVDPSLKSPRVLATAPQQTNAQDPATFVGAIAGHTENGNVLQISVSPAMVGGEPTPVALFVRTPSCEGIRVSNSGGGVRLFGVGGAIDVVSGVPIGAGGSIHLVTDRNLTEGVSLLTSAGNILLMMGEGSSGEVEVRGSGGASVLLPDTSATGVKQDARGWSGRVGEGGAKIRVVSEKGACDVRFSEEPRTRALHGER
jgi:hypothetical protein